MRRFAVLLMTIPLALVGYGVTAASATTAPLHISITIGTDGTGPVTLSGAINQTGTFTILSLRQAGRSHTSHGTFRVDLPDGSYSGKFTVIQQTATVDPSTCIETDTGKGIDIINNKLGTGAYAGLKGTGHFTEVATITGTSTPDGCDFSNATSSNQIEGDGHVKLAA